MKGKVMRILIYEGEIEIINKSLSQRAVKGSFTVPGRVTITETFLPEFAEAMDIAEAFARQEAIREGVEERLKELGRASNATNR